MNLRLPVILLLACASALAQIPPLPTPVAGEWGYVVYGDPHADIYGTPPVTTGFEAGTAKIAAWATTYLIKFVIIVGDFTWGAGANEFAADGPAMANPANAGIPIFILPGNHDYPGGTPGPSPYTAFASALLAGKSYVYAVQDPTNYFNVAYTINLPGGKKLLVIALQDYVTATPPGPTILAWAQATEAAWLAANPGGNVWLATHEYRGDVDLNNVCTATPSRNTTGTYLWTNWLSIDGAVSVEYNGHFGSAFNLCYWASAQSGGGTLNQMQINYQDHSPGAPNRQTLTVFRVQASGHVDGCSYTAYTSSWWGAGDCASFDVPALGSGQYPSTTLSGTAQVSGQAVIH